MATSHLPPQPCPVERIAGAAVTLMTLALVMGSIVALMAAVGP
jgi:hypothetical protein